MTQYKVLADFNDPDHSRVYYKGGMYPAPGKMASPARIAYLSGNTNRFGKPVIEAVGTPEPARAGKRTEFGAANTDS